MVRIGLLFGSVGFLLIVAGAARAQDQSAESALNAPAEFENAAPETADQLSIDQARLADRFKRLEEAIGQLAEFSASSDPRRARLLRQAIAQSRELDIHVRFESIVKLLEDERLAAATRNQKELQQELETLLDLLLKADRDKELASERDRIRKYLKETIRLLRLQRGIRARTEGGDGLRGLGRDQQQVADDTKKLGGELSDDERKERGGGNADGAENKPTGNDEEKTESSGEAGKQGEPSKSGDDSEKQGEQPGDKEPSEGQSGEPSNSPPSDSGQRSEQSGQPGQSGSPSQANGSSEPQPSQEPTQRAAERLRRAAQQMDEARKKLEEAEREGASDRQREAMRELEIAKAELERVLRQLREEELERTLTQLAARFRKMLDLQNQVYEGTRRLDEIPEAQRDHDDEIESGRLSRQEAEIVVEADKALLLLREEGSSIAFPEIVEQMRDDMRTVVGRLAEFNVGSVTQGLEEDIIAALEETIAALEEARKDLEKKRNQPGGSGGSPADPELVDKMAELKLIRSLQMRINQRTQRYGKMIDGEQADVPDLLEALEELSERQRRVYQAIMELERGLNQ